MEELLTAADVARILRCHPKTPYLLASEGRLPAVRLGPRMVRFRRVDVDRLIQDRLISESKALVGAAR